MENTSGTYKLAGNTSNDPKNFRPNLSTQAQKFDIFEKKLSLGVRSPCNKAFLRFAQRNFYCASLILEKKCVLLSRTFVVEIKIFCGHFKQDTSGNSVPEYVGTTYLTPYRFLNSRNLWQ